VAYAVVMMSIATTYLTPNEVASICRVGVWQVWRWIAAGRIVAIRRPSGRYLIAREELVRLGLLNE